MKKLLVIGILLALTGCGKVGIGGKMSQLVGSWAEVRLPQNCVPAQISADSNGGVSVLCQDGRVFH